MDTSFISYYSSPIGWIEIAGTHEGISSVLFVDNQSKAVSENLPAHVSKCQTQLDEYFKGNRQHFDLPLIVKGTQFQMQVWEELAHIPYGKLTTYKALAHKLKTPAAIRAIGNANSRNRLCLIIPCHRVVGSDTNLVGYAGGIWRKEWLIEHEANTGGGFKQLKLF